MAQRPPLVIGGDGLPQQLQAGDQILTAGDSIHPYSSNKAIPAGNTVSNTAVETPFASTVLIPANTLRAGDCLEPRTWGLMGIAPTIPSLEGRVYLVPASVYVPGAPPASTYLILDTGAVAGLTTGNNLFWRSEISLLFMAVGSSGQLEAAGLMEFQSSATAVLAVAAKNTSTLTVNTTVDLLLVYTADFSTASTMSYIQIRQLTVK